MGALNWSIRSRPGAARSPEQGWSGEGSDWDRHGRNRRRSWHQVSSKSKPKALISERNSGCPSTPDSGPLPRSLQDRLARSSPSSHAGALHLRPRRPAALAPRRMRMAMSVLARLPPDRRALGHEGCRGRGPRRGICADPRPFVGHLNRRSQRAAGSTRLGNVLGATRKGAYRQGDSDKRRRRGPPQDLGGFADLGFGRTSQAGSAQDNKIRQRRIKMRPLHLVTSKSELCEADPATHAGAAPAAGAVLRRVCSTFCGDPAELAPRMQHKGMS